MSTIGKFYLGRMLVALLLGLAAWSISCRPPTAPTQRNIDGTIHKPGSDLQPWIPITNRPIEEGDDQ